MNNATNLH